MPHAHGRPDLMLLPERRLFPLAIMQADRNATVKEPTVLTGDRASFCLQHRCLIHH
jgi:hypothetical protein